MCIRDRLSLALEFEREMVTSFRDLSGTANLEQLLQLRQMPGAETIRAYYEALTPELRQEGLNLPALLTQLGGERFVVRADRLGAGHLPQLEELFEVRRAREVTEAGDHLAFELQRE